MDSAASTAKVLLGLPVRGFGVSEHRADRAELVGLVPAGANGVCRRSDLPGWAPRPFTPRPFSRGATAGAGAVCRNGRGGGARRQKEGPASVDAGPS
jgi:hypothetical protein